MIQYLKCHLIETSPWMREICLKLISDQADMILVSWGKHLGIIAEFMLASLNEWIYLFSPPVLSLKVYSSPPAAGGLPHFSNS